MKGAEVTDIYAVSPERGRPRWRCAALAVIAVAASCAMFAQKAEAYSDLWSCSNAYSAQTCYSGAGYHSWQDVAAGIGPSRSEICAKGVTAAGNIRSGSGCNYNTNYRYSGFSGGTPTSAGYVYWAGSGSATDINGSAAT